MKNHKYKFGRRINWRSILLAMVFPICFTVSHYANLDNTYVAEKKVAVYMTATVVEHPQDESIETKMRKYFPKNHKTMIAVAHAESGMSMKAVGYNCYYSGGKATTTPIKGGSKACKVEDRHLAWSRDCGILQMNTTAKTCPKETVDEHLKRAADLSRKQGLEAWVAYNLKMHEKHLAQQ